MTLSRLTLLLLLLLLVLALCTSIAAAEDYYDVLRGSRVSIVVAMDYYGVLPRVEFSLIINDVNVSVSYRVVNGSSSGYSLLVNITPYYAGFSATLRLVGGSSVAAVYKLWVSPWTVYMGSRVVNVIDYELDLVEASRPPRGLNATLLVVYGARIPVRVVDNRIDWVYTSAGLTRSMVKRVDVLPTSRLEWPIYVSPGLSPPSARLVYNGTAMQVDMATFNHTYDFALRAFYEGEEHYALEMFCYWGCTETCRSHAFIIEAYDADTGAYLGRVGVTTYCPRRSTVYVKLDRDLMLRAILVSDRPELAFWISVPRPRNVGNPMARSLLAAMLLGAVVAGLIRSSLRDTAISLIAGSVMLSLVSPYLGAYRLYPLYIAIGAVGAILLMVVLVKGE